MRKGEKSLIWGKEEVCADKENVNPGLIDLHNQYEILNKPPSCEPDDVQRPTDIEIVENSMPCDQNWQSISAGRSIKGMQSPSEFVTVEGSMPRVQKQDSLKGRLSYDKSSEEVRFSKRVNLKKSTSGLRRKSDGNIWNSKGSSDNNALLNQDKLGNKEDGLSSKIVIPF